MYIVTLDGNYLHHPKLKLFVFNPKVTLETNSTGAFDFTIYPSNPLYSSIKRFKSIIEVYDDGELIFRGRPLNDTLNLNKSLKIQCEGELAYLNDSQMIPYEHHGTVNELISKFINNHNSQVEASKQFTLGNVNVDGKTEDGKIVRSSIEYSNTWEEIKNKLINMLGGYLVLRRENDTNYIDYIADSPYQSGQSVELTKNILDYQQEIKADEIATVIIPLGAKLEDEEGRETDVRLDVSSVNQGKPYIEHTEGINKYGRIWAVQIWDDVTLPENLKSRGQSSLNALVNLGVKLSIKAIDLNLVDSSIPKIKHFNYIRVFSNPHQIDELMLIKKQTIYLDNPQQNTIEVGVEFSTFTEKQLQSDHTIKQIQADYITNEKVHKILNPIHLQVSSILQDFESIRLSVRDIQTTYQEIVDSPITAYEIAVANGFTGTQEEWIESLKGADGTSVKILGTRNDQSELPTANNLAGDGYMIEGDLWIWTGTQWTNVGRIQGQNGKDGIGYQLILTGDDGLVFDSTTDTIARTLRAKVYVNNQDVTDTLPNSYFLWTRLSNYSEIDNEFNSQGIRNKVLTLSSYYLKTNATYKCTLVIPSISGYLLDANYNFILDGQGNKIIATSYSLTFEQQITIVKDVQPQITTLTSEVNLLAGQIELKVNQSTVDQLTNRVATNESNITLTQNEISSKVSQTDFTGAKVVSMINQTASSVKIQAKNISLEGLTTVNNGFIVNMDGSITATSGNIAGWSIGNGFLDHASAGRRLRFSTIDNYSIYAGTDGSNWNFILNKNGTLQAKNADISGKITATSGSFTGKVTATSGSFTGTVTATSGYFSDITCDRLTIRGSSFSGNAYMGSGRLGGSNFSTDGGYAYINFLRAGALLTHNFGMTDEKFTMRDAVAGNQATIRMMSGKFVIVNSDIRIKKDVKEVDFDYNDMIYTMPIISYRYKESENTSPRSIGINANAVDEKYGRENTQFFINQMEDGYYAVNYESLVPMLIKVVQSQNERLLELERKINEPN